MVFQPASIDSTSEDYSFSSVMMDNANNDTDNDAPIACLYSMFGLKRNKELINAERLFSNGESEDNTIMMK